MRKCAPSRNGFALVEVLVVIQLTALLVLISTGPLSKYLRALTVRGTAFQMAAELEGAKLSALAAQGTATWTAPAKSSSVIITPVKSISFASSGFPVPGSSGTWTVSVPQSKARKVVISSVGRIRLE